MADHERVLILGLDGVPWSLLDPWLAEGKLPHLAEVIARGVRSDLRSTIPYVTAPAWTSCVTGVNPGKHGVLDFAIRPGHGYGITVVNARSVRAKPLWTLLGEAGKRVGMVNVPVTYPPQPVNGALVGCMLTPSLASRFTYPDSLREELLAAVPSYAIEPMTPSSDLARTKAELARNLSPTLQARAQAARWLMQWLGDWDFFMVVFTEPDRLMTYAWDDFDASHPRHDPRSAALYGDLFLRHYQELDAVVGQFVDEWRERATILIMSDHGFAGVHTFFYPNVWLQQNGLLALNHATLPSLLSVAQSAARRLGLAHQAKKLVKRLIPDWGFTTGARDAGFVGAVDWQRTRVFWGADDGLTINLRGRQPQGIVNQEDYEPLRDDLIARWSELREPESGELVAERVYRREEIYSGRYVESSPDLRVVWKEYPQQRKVYSTAGELWARDCWGLSGQTGDHAPVGVLMATGRHVVQGARLPEAQIADIAPTALYALGQPAPTGMDGHVLAGVFSADFCAALEEASTSGAAAVSDGTVAVPAQPDSYSADEQAEIEARLKALGYLD